MTLTEAHNESSQFSSESDRPFVSIVVPAYNEAAIVQDNLKTLHDYMISLENNYSWEMIVVDDGSSDQTGELIDEFVKTRDNLHVIHHVTNFQLGQALRSGFNRSRGKYVVVMDIDLTYSPDHIPLMLKTIEQTGAKIVIASPYVEGGKTTAIPWMRRLFSKWANRFLSLTAKGRIRTITGMVRAYDRQFLMSLNTKAMDMAINVEIIYKAQLLRGLIVEVPAHLDWSFQKGVEESRTSSMKVAWNTLSCLFSGFLFRPFMFFILPGIFLGLLSLYPIAWALVHTFAEYPSAGMGQSVGYDLSDAVASAFELSPHSFIVGGFALMIAIQLISLGVLSLQNKRYFEELFHLGTWIHRTQGKRRYE